MEDSANTIVVIGKSNPPVYAACVVLATHRLDVNRAVKQRLGTRKASFASQDETRALTGMAIGGVTAFGLPDGLPLWVDAAVMARERIVLGGGSRSWKVIAPPSILLTLPASRSSRPREPVRTAALDLGERRGGGLDLRLSPSGRWVSCGRAAHEARAAALRTVEPAPRLESVVGVPTYDRQ